MCVNLSTFCKFTQTRSKKIYLHKLDLNRVILQDSWRKLLWEIVAGKSCGKILREILAGNFLSWMLIGYLSITPYVKSYGKLLQEILVGNCCRKLLRENPVGDCCGKFLWEIVAGKCSEKILWENLAGKCSGKCLRQKSCGKFLVLGADWLSLNHPICKFM